MSAEQKFKLAKVAMKLTTLVITIMYIVFMVLTHNPKILNASMDIKNQKVEFYCTFVSEKEEE